MKTKSVGWIKKYGWQILLCFVVPVAIMTVSYYSIGIYPGSERSILASDSFTQYANFHASFNNILHGKQNVFYTWYGSLGLNNWSFMSYYLNGLFTFLVYFFDNAFMPDTIYFLTLLKFGAMGVSFWILAHQTFKLPGWIKVGLSICYAMMSYAVAYSEVIMWLDAFVYLPLIILGIHRLMDKQKPTLLFISYLCLFLSNFYLAFMIGVFSFLYFFARTFTDSEKYKKAIIPYFITSLLAGGASMIVILPTLLDLSNNGEGLNTLGKFLTSDTGPWDFVTKSMVGVYDTSQYKSAPFIYIGLFPLLCCLFYFITKKIPLKNKLLYGSLFIVLIASVYIEPLNLFWHGLHAPNMFLFRFSFLFSFLVILLAGYGLEQFAPEDKEQLLNGGFLIGALFLLVVIFSNKKRYDYITTETLIVSLLLLVVYIAFFFVYQQPLRLKKWLPLLFLVVVTGEMFFNSKEMISGILVDWNYPSRSYYTDSYDDIKTLVDQTKLENDTLYRMDSLDQVSANDSFNFGYSGVSMFSSIRNRHSSAYLNNLGFRSLGTNLTISYLNNTLIMDSLLGIKYNLSKEDPMKFGFKKRAASGEYSLYENDYALPLGILTDEGIYEEGAVPNQTELLNYLAEQESAYFTFVEPKVVDTNNITIENAGEDVIYAEKEPVKEKSVTWEVTVPAYSQAYLSIYSDDYTLMRDLDVSVTVNGITRNNGVINSGQYYNLGYYEKTEKVKVTAAFNGTPKAVIAKPDVAILDTKLFQKTVSILQEKGIEFQTSGRKATATVDLDKDQVLFTTIPYDKGWKAYIDGENVEIPTFKDAFLALPVSSGKHTVEFVFLPQGFKIGAILFVVCITLFIIYVLIFYKKPKKDLPLQREEEEMDHEKDN